MNSNIFSEPGGEPTLSLAPMADTVTSAQARVGDPTLVHVAAAVYDPAQLKAGEWERLSDEQLANLGLDPAALRDDSSGFLAGIYSGAKSTALAFAGTDMTSLSDWKTNLGQGAGLQTTQYAQAVALAKNVRLAFEKTEVVITGHSLGGGLATAAAAATGIDAVVFNPAGVNDKTLKREGLDPDQVQKRAASGQIRNYIVDGEILNAVQTFLPIPKPIGQRVALPDPSPMNPMLKWLPGANVVHAGNLHAMASVKEAFAQFEQQHESFFQAVPAMKPVGGQAYTGQLLSVPVGRTGEVTQQVGDQLITHDRAKLATQAGTLKSGNNVTIKYNEQATVGVVKRSRTQGQGVRM